MDAGIYQAIRGSLIQGRRFDIITNNLANVGTTGFKKDVLTFDQALQEYERTDLRQGNVRLTGNSLDIALEGDGFFKIKTPDGIRYTRNGNFCLNANGLLVTQNGDPVLGENGPIVIEGDDIAIDTHGRITADETVVDTLSVAKFAQPERLQKEGLWYCIYNGDEKEIVRPEDVLVKQGYLEESNVMVVEEMSRMIETLRTYESYQKVIQIFDETSHKAINEVGRVQ
ncbi:MAG: flagellar hook-basal body protein [Deltaproteobacteria bacterium]|nr:flagellar hook-basal body protein [Deltaproteobacteria bacterium]MBW1795370.1 flagellar hook-basal body protein [Deltaproteobacteria bacterium]